MKKTLLITTALVAVISASNAYSQVLEDLVVNDTQNISNQGGPNYPYYYQSITVGKNGSLSLNTSKIATEQDVTINGSLTANKSALASGKDDEVNGTIGNMSFDGATVNLTDSDLESTGDITISGTSLSNRGTITDNLTPFIKYGEEDGIDMDNLYGIWTEGNISVDNSNISLDKSYMGAVGTLEISDNSSLTLNTSRIDTDAITIDDTTINATNSAIHGMFDITVNSGETTLDNAELTVDVGEADSSGEYKQGNFTLNDGTINLKNGGSFGVEISDGTTLSQGSVKIAGGKVNVEKSGHIVANSIDMSGGEINVNQNTVLNLVRQATSDENNNIEYTEFATIDLSGDGTVNLSGTLNGSINGSGGNLNFNSSTSNISGNVTGTNLSFDSNHSLSKAVKGTIGEITSLNVKNNSIFNFDKDTGTITSLNIANGSTFNANKNMTLVNFNNEGSVNLTDAYVDVASALEFNSGKITAVNSDITTQEDITVNGGEFSNNNSDLETFKTITINDGTLNLNNSSDLTALNGLTISGGTVNVDDGELWSLGNINLNGGNVTLTNSAAITTSQEDLDEIFQNTELPSTKGNISVDGANVTLTNSAITTDGNLNITSGTLSVDGGLYEVLGSTEVTGGTLSVSDIKATSNNINIVDGKVNLTNAEINAWEGNTSISGGEINLTGEGNKETGLYARKEFNVDGGTINMNGGYTVINNIADYKPDEYEHYDLNITGGTINVNAGNGEISSSKNVNIDGGIINIAKGATLGIYGGNEKAETTALIGADATFNISGTLDTNIEGAGNINMSESSANITGDVNGSNLSFYADHSLNNAILGTIGDLASLNVKKGTLTFDKTVGSINNLNVDGTLDIGTNAVSADNVEFKDNSTLALRIAGVDNHGKLSADNFTISENNTTMNVTIDNGIVANGETKEFQVLEGSFDGYFANKIADNSRYDIVWGDNNGKLTITGEATASDVVSDAGGSSTNADTAEAWDSVSQSSSVSENAKEVSSVLNNLSQNANTSEGKKAYVEALTALAPEIAPVIQQTATETINQVVNAVSTRLTGGGSMSAGGKGASIGGKGNNMSRGHKGGHGHKNTNGHRNHRGGASGDSFFEKAALWVQTLFNKSELEDTSSSSGFDSETTGVAFGAEKSVTDNTKIGLGYAYSQTDIDGLNRTTDVDTHTAILYGEYKPSQWYVNGVVTYGWSDYTEHKNVAGVNVEAKYDAESFGLQTMTGYEMNAQGYTIVPEVGLRFVHIEQDTYTDTADQTVSSDDTDTLTGVIATKVSKTWELDNGAYITPEVKVAATYDLSNDGSTSVVTLANGSAYTVNGEELDKLGFEFSAGITAEINDKVEFSVGYEGKFKEDYQDHSALLNVKYNF